MEKITTIKQIKDNIDMFNEGKNTNRDVIEILLRQVTYWVYDIDKSQFAPSKFVQCIGMTFLSYKQLTGINRPKHRGGFGGGGQARKHIQKVAGGKKFTKNTCLRTKLEKWANQLGIKVRGVYKSGFNEGKDKWKFLEL